MGKKKYIDQIDINLLNIIKAYPNYSIAEIGQVIDLSPGPTHTRLINLREKGILRSDFKINYRKLGLKEKVCLFEIKLNLIYCKILNYKDFLPDMHKKLSKSNHVIVESIERYNDEEGRSWVMIRFYPVINEKHISGAAGPRKVYFYEYEIGTLLREYVHLGVKYFHLEQKEEVIPLLTPHQRMKNEPPQ